MSKPSSFERIIRVAARVVWGILFAFCAWLLSLIWSDPRDANGFITAGWTIVPFLGSVGIMLLAPFLVVLRGRLPLVPTLVAAVSLAAGASTLYSLGEFAVSPHVFGGSAWQFALGNAPINAFIFGIGSLAAWILSKICDAFSPARP